MFLPTRPAAWLRRRKTRGALMAAMLAPARAATKAVQTAAATASKASRAKPPTKPPDAKPPAAKILVPKTAAPKAVSAKPARAATKTATQSGPQSGLKAGLKTAAPLRIRAAGPPRGARFLAGRFSCEAGTRAYKLYVPAAAAGQAGAGLPLVVMLHGCGQTPDDFARGTRMNALAEARGVIVLYPAQPRDAHANRCWNWFRPADQERDGGEPAILAGMVRMILDGHPADPARVYVAGLSAGASAAMTLAHAYPELFAAVGCHSGLPRGAARDHGGALIAMQRGSPGTRLAHPMPTIVFHGSEDHVVAPRNGRLVALRALETHPRLTVVEQARQVPDGRAYVRTSHRIGRGRSWVEHWLVKGSGHAWSGGARAGRFVDPAGPDASAEMLRFFLRHRAGPRRRGPTPVRG